MQNSDPSAERHRLTQLYAEKTEAELQQLAEGAFTLTEIARDALKSELLRRDMKVELREQPAAEVHPELVKLRQFRDLPPALLAKSILDSANIECFLADENTVRMDWLWSNAIGGVKLWVKQENAEDASALLDQQLPDNFEVEGVGEFKNPRCPICDSPNISYEELHKPLSYASVAIGVPMKVKRHRWKCSACGHEWFDESEPAN
jgi:hypothetical protein